MRVKQARPDVSLLFDSTIAEPTAALVDVVREAFSGPLTSRYVSVFADGNRFAIEAVARRYRLDPEQILATTGATSAMSLAFKALVSFGDEVLVERPGFDLLTRLALEAGAKVRTFDRRAPDYRVDLAEFESRLTSRTRAVLLTNLHNPSGARLSEADLAAIAACAATAGATVMVDEIYADFSAPRGGAPPAASLAPNIVTVSSLTKVFGLFALKFGWMAANPELIDRLRRHAPDGDLGVSKLAHAVAAHVLERPDAFEAHWRSILDASRPVLESHVADMAAEGLLTGALPAHGCMYFPALPGVRDTRALSQRLLREFEVLVAPGEYFGAPGHIRIGFGAAAPVVELGLQRLRTGLTQIRGR